MASGKPIETVITTNVDDVVSGAEKTADSFKDIQDTLKDTAKASDKSAESMQDDFKDAAKVIDRDLTKALDDVSDAAKSSGRSIGKNIKDGTDHAGKGMEELRDESKSTAKEAAASFSDVTDAADALQEVVANAFVGFGPAGMAAGLAAAVGIGLAISALTDNAEKINENKTKMLELAGEIRDAGGDLSKVDFVKRMQDWGLAIQDTKEWWEVWQKDAKSGFDVVKEESRKAGTDWQSAFKGAHGTMEDSLKFLKDTDAQFNSLNDEISNAGETVDEFGRGQSNLSTETLTAADSLKKQREAAQQNAEAVRDANRAAWDAVNVGKSENKVLEEQLTLKNHLADANKSAVSSELDLIDSVEKTKASLEESNATFRDGSQASRDLERDVLNNASAMGEWAQKQVDAGENVDVVNQKLDGYKQNLIDQATKFFGSRDAAAAYIEQILKTPKKVDTDINLNGIPDAEEKVRAFVNQGRHLFIDLKTGDASAVENYIAGMNGRKVYVDIAPRNGVGITN